MPPTAWIKFSPIRKFICGTCAPQMTRWFMSERYDHCPECKSDDLEIVSIHDIRPPKRLLGKASQSDRPVARTLWIRCRSCGWDGSILRKVDEAGPAA